MLFGIQRQNPLGKNDLLRWVIPAISKNIFIYLTLAALRHYFYLKYMEVYYKKKLEVILVQIFFAVVVSVIIFFILRKVIIAVRERKEINKLFIVP